MKNEDLKKMLPEQAHTSLTSRRNSYENVYGTSQDNIGSRSREKVLDLRNIDSQVPEISRASGGWVENNLTPQHDDSQEEFDKNKIQTFILKEM